MRAGRARLGWYTGNYIHCQLPGDGWETGINPSPAQTGIR